VADKPALAHAVAAPAAPAARAWDAAFLWFTVAYGLLNFGQGVFPPLLPQIMDGLGLEFATVGLLGSAFGLARFAVDLPAGLMTERQGPLAVLHMGIACLLGGTLLSAWAPSLPFMLLARALVGVGSGLTIVVSILFVMRRGPAASRTRRGNVYEIGVIGGTGLSAWLGGQAAAQLGWRGGFVVAAAAIAAAWALVALRLGPALRELGAPAPSPRPPAATVRNGTPWGAVLAIYLATFTLAVSWAGGIGTFLPLYGGRALGLPADALGRVLSAAYAIEAAALVPVGWAADTLGRVPVLAAGFLVMLAGAAAVPLTAGTAGFGVAATLLVLGLTTWMVPPVLLAERLPGGFRGPAAGVYRLVSDFAYIIAPGAVGWSIGRHGFRATGFLMAGLVAVALLVAVPVLGRRPRAA
jgi:MFS family permease